MSRTHKRYSRVNKVAAAVLWPLAAFALFAPRAEALTARELKQAVSNPKAYVVNLGKQWCERQRQAWRSIIYKELNSPDKDLVRFSDIDKMLGVLSGKEILHQDTIKMANHYFHAAEKDGDFIHYLEDSLKDGSPEPERVKATARMMLLVKSINDRKLQIFLVNMFENAITKYNYAKIAVSDAAPVAPENWYQSPQETGKTGWGTCADYAIKKTMILSKGLRIDARIALVSVSREGWPYPETDPNHKRHAVSFAVADGQKWVLDNTDAGPVVRELGETFEHSVLRWASKAGYMEGEAYSFAPNAVSRAHGGTYQKTHELYADMTVHRCDLTVVKGPSGNEYYYKSPSPYPADFSPETPDNQLSNLLNRASPQDRETAMKVIWLAYEARYLELGENPYKWPQPVAQQSEPLKMSFIVKPITVIKSDGKRKGYKRPAANGREYKKFCRAFHNIY